MSNLRAWYLECNFSTAFFSERTSLCTDFVTNASRQGDQESVYSAISVACCVFSEYAQNQILGNVLNLSHPAYQT